MRSLVIVGADMREDSGCAQAGKKLVVLEVESVDVCQTGFEEEAEIHYKVDQKKALEPCGQIKHIFQRTARDCPDIEFLAIEVRLSNGSAINAIMPN